MKKIKLVFIIISLLLSLSCKDETTILSATKDGEELEEGSLVPFWLSQNYPNPFNPSTTIRFALAKKMKLKMSVHTEDWELVKILLDKELVPGYYTYTFDAVNSDGKWLPSGNYYYTLEGDGYSLTMQMTLVK